MSNEHVEAAFAAWFVRRHGTGATCHHGDLFAEHEKIGFVGGFQEGVAFAQRPIPSFDEFQQYERGMADRGSGLTQEQITGVCLFYLWLESRIPKPPEVSHAK